MNFARDREAVNPINKLGGTSTWYLISVLDGYSKNDLRNLCKNPHLEPGAKFAIEAYLAGVLPIIAELQDKKS